MTKIKCAICGAEFEPPDNRYRLYCSKECAKEAQRAQARAFYKNKREKIRKKRIELNNAVIVAEQNKMSYGQYMAQKYIDEHRMKRGRENELSPMQ